MQEQEQDFQVIQSMLKPGAGVGVIKTWSIATCIRILIRVYVIEIAATESISR